MYVFSARLLATRAHDVPGELPRRSGPGRRECAAGRCVMKYTPVMAGGAGGRRQARLDADRAGRRGHGRGRADGSARAGRCRPSPGRTATRRRSCSGRRCSSSSRQLPAVHVPAPARSRGSASSSLARPTIGARPGRMVVSSAAPAYVSAAAGALWGMRVFRRRTRVDALLLAVPIVLAVAGRVAARGASAGVRYGGLEHARRGRADRGAARLQPGADGRPVAQPVHDHRSRRPARLRHARRVRDERVPLQRHDAV